MDGNQIPEYEQLRIIYNEIIAGCSFSASKKVFVKHLTESENASIVKRRHVAFDHYHKEEGIPSQKEKVEQLYADGRWTKQNDERIEDLKQIISDNEKMMKTVLVEQQAVIKFMVEKDRKELKQLLEEKSDLVGPTADDYAEKESYHQLLSLSFYRDEAMTQKIFGSIEDVQDLEIDEIGEYSDALEETFAKLKEENVRKISVLPFFVNPFSFCKDHVYTFLNKPIAHLSSFQLMLISLGSRNLNVLSQAQGEPPELLGDTKIQDVIDWYDQQYSILLGKRNTSGQTGITKSTKEVSK